MPPAELDSAIPTGERPQTHALDRAATEIDMFVIRTKYQSKHRVKYSWLGTVIAIPQAVQQ